MKKIHPRKTNETGRRLPCYPRPLDTHHELVRWLAPMGPERFVAEIFRKRHFQFKADRADRFEDLFSLERLSRILADGFPASKALAFTAERQPIAISELSGRGRKTSQLDAGAIARLVRRGGSLSLKGLQEIDASLFKLARDLESWTGHEHAFINLYYTPKGSQTFGWHFDCRDVFVLQIHGSKKWDIYAPHYRLPFSSMDPLEYVASGCTKANSKRLESLVLHQGDLLYLPACFPHEVKCLDSRDSLHLTIGLVPLQRHQFLLESIRETLNTLREVPEFRVPIFPTQAGKLDPREIRLLQGLLRKLIRKIGPADLNRLYGDHLSRTVRAKPDLRDSKSQNARPGRSSALKRTRETP